MCILMHGQLHSQDKVVVVGSLVTIRDARYPHRTRTTLKVVNRVLAQLSKWNSLSLFLPGPAGV